LVGTFPVSLMVKNQSPHEENPAEHGPYNWQFRGYSHTREAVRMFHSAMHPSYMCKTRAASVVNAVMIRPRRETCRALMHSPEFVHHNFASFVCATIMSMVAEGN